MRGDDLPDKARRAAIEILRHLKSRPEAMDTPDGILQWWLPQSSNWSREDVTMATGYLAEHGWLRIWYAGAGTEVVGPSPKFLADPSQAFEALQPKRGPLT